MEVWTIKSISLNGGDLWLVTGTHHEMIFSCGAQESSKLYLTGWSKMMLWNSLFGCILLHTSFSTQHIFSYWLLLLFYLWLCWVHLFGKDVLFWTKAWSSTGSQQSGACGEDRLGRCCGFSEPTSTKFSSFRMVGRFIDNCTKYDPHTYHVGRSCCNGDVFKPCIIIHTSFKWPEHSGWCCFFNVLYPAETNAHYFLLFFLGVACIDSSWKKNRFKHD